MSLYVSVQYVSLSSCLSSLPLCFFYCFITSTNALECYIPAVLVLLECESICLYILENGDISDAERQ